MIVEPIPLPFQIDWGKSFFMEIGFENTVLEMHSGFEQRAALIVNPKIRYTYTITALEAKEASALLARVWGDQSFTWWVPYWPGETLLSGDIAIGSTSLGAPTYGLTVGEGIMFLRDTDTYEVVEITAIGPNPIDIITVTPTTKLWKGSGGQRDRAVAVAMGNFTESSEAQFPDVDMGGITLDFYIQHKNF